MKKILLILSVITLFCSCQKESDNKDISKEITIWVDSQTTEYTPWGSDMLYEGIKIKESENDDWQVLPLNGIEGFAYEAGYEYKLLVLKTTLANPPMDASSVTYRLIEIVEKIQGQDLEPLSFQAHGGEISQFSINAPPREYIGVGYDNEKLEPS